MKRLALAAAAATLLITPAASDAKGGGGGGGAGTPTPAAPCVPVTPLNSGAVDKPASRKRVVLELMLRNCGTSTATFGTRIVGTTQSLRSTDPYIVELCPTPEYGGQTVSLKAGESREVTAPATVGYCAGSPWGTSPWGIDLTYTVEYAISAYDLATGAVSGTATSYVGHSGGD